VPETRLIAWYMGFETSKRPVSCSCNRQINQRHISALSAVLATGI